MLAADRIFFDSEYHRDVFFTELLRLLKQVPDYNNLDAVSELAVRGETLAPGLDLARFDWQHPLELSGGPLRILWNHR